MKRVEVLEPGGPDRMRIADVAIPVPGPNDALVAIHASGVNFLDTYFRSGLYKSETPVILGSEGAGVVERVGADVTEISPGDRVAYAMIRGSYAEYAVVAAAQLVKIPAGVDFTTAAAVMLQGMTAHYLTRSTFPLSAEHTCLVHAAAGGAGRMTVQMAKERGARVIGTVSTEAKANDIRALGIDAVIVYTTHDFETEVKRLTDGRGVDVVYDAVGAATFDKSLRVIRPRGTMVLFGQSSGPVPPFDLNQLNPRGSLYVTRPSLAHYLATRDELLWRANDVLGLVAGGALHVHVWKTYPLAEAARAHHDLESRMTSGKLVLNVR